MGDLWEIYRLSVAVMPVAFFNEKYHHCLADLLPMQTPSHLAMKGFHGAEKSEVEYESD